jgi:O-antigen ligase
LGPVNSFSIVDVAIPLVLAILLLTRPRPALPSLAVRMEILAICAFVLTRAVSVLWAPRWTMWTRETVLMVLNLGIFGAGYMLITSGTAMRIWRAYGALGLGAVAITVVYRIWRPEALNIYPRITDSAVITSWQFRLGSPTWGASNLFASTMLAFLSLYSALAILGKARRTRWFFAAASVIVSAMILLTLSAGGIAAVIVSLLALLVLASRRRLTPTNMWFPLKLGVLSVLILLGLWILWASLPAETAQFAAAKFRDLVQHFTTLDRLRRFESAFAFAAEHPLGAGLGNYSPQGHESSRYLVHNGYLQALVETGWFGVVALGGLFWAFLSVNTAFVRQSKGTYLEPYAIGATAGLIGFLFHMLGEPIFEATITGWLLWLLQGMVAGSQSLLAALSPDVGKGTASRSRTLDHI